MSETKKKLFLTTIAKAREMKPEEVLAALTPHALFFAYVKNVTHINGNKVKWPYSIIPVLETYLNLILSKREWKGNQITVLINDLFVYEHELFYLERQIPDIFSSKDRRTSIAQGRRKPVCPGRGSAGYAR